MYIFVHACVSVCVCVCVSLHASELNSRVISNCWHISFLSDVINTWPFKNILKFFRDPHLQSFLFFRNANLKWISYSRSKWGIKSATLISKY